MHRTRNAAYGQPYRGFESLPLRHELNARYISHFCISLDANSCADSGSLRHAHQDFGLHRDEFFQIAGICAGASHLRNFGGTGVSRSGVGFVAREPDLKQRDSLVVRTLLIAWDRGAPGAFSSLLGRIRIYARGNGQPRDTLCRRSVG
jgi:hypothetical protein